MADEIAALDTAANAGSIDMKDIGKHAAAIAEMTNPGMAMDPDHGKMKPEM